MEAETAEERQENEVEVLKAIYENDFEDLRDKDVWKIKRPPEFRLKIRPNHDSAGHFEEHCSVDLHLKFPAEYPHVVPIITVEDSKGLSNDRTSELCSMLEAEARSKVGEVMILELAQNVSVWLSGHNKPHFESIYAEMEARNREVQEKTQQRIEKQKALDLQIAEREKEAIKLEVAKTAEALREEKQKMREEGKLRSSDLPEPRMARSVSSTRRNSTSQLRSVSESSGSLAGDPLTGSGVEQICFQYKGGERISVEKGTRIGGNTLGGSIHAGIVSSSGRLVAVAEWKFRTNRKKKRTSSGGGEIYDEKSLLKQLGSVEQELLSIQKISHPNVVQYLGMSYGSSGKDGTVDVCVVQEFVQGSNLSYYLSENLQVDLATLKYYCIGILEALDFMHEHNFVHRDLRDTSVYTSSGGIVKVGDFSIDKRIRDLYVHDKDDMEEKFPLAIGRGGKKLDIYRFGLLTLSLAQGSIVQDVIPAIPKGVPPEFADFLKKCVMKDEKDRWSARQLLGHKWIKQQIERSPVRETGRADSPDDNEEEPIQTMPFVHIPEGSGQSRLQNEFAFIDQIGKGGFGEVMKVKNNLDGQVYAIKRIKLNPKNRQLNKKLMREVKLLSRLNHENVVRYYNSWLEVTTITSDTLETETSFTEETTSHLPLKKKEDSFLLEPKINTSFGEESNSEFSFSYSSRFVADGELSSDSSDDDDDDVFGTSFLPQCADWSPDESADGIVFENSAIPEEEEEEEEERSEGIVFARETTEQSSSTESEVETKRQIHYMYIQMEFCDKQTLRNAIDQNLYKDMERVWRMFREIIEGLFHIHTQGMIHRDLKPVNIFIDSLDHVKIGDFGLATTNMMDIVSANDSMDATLDNDMTGQIGTALYVAPELKAGRSVSYNQKVDIYSLGVIFFEMCYAPLQTGMERIKILTDLRSEDIKFPEEFDQSLLVQHSFILRWLLNHDPAQRPTSLELLQSDYLPPPQVEEAELKEMIRHTLANSQSKSYRHLIDSCLNQKMSLAQDISYDMEVQRDMKKLVLGQEYVKGVCQKVFQRHGAIEIPTSYLLPVSKSKIIERSDNLVQVMTRSGGVVSLPYDLRVPFARYIARVGASDLRRYNIAPVFREKRVYGVHPRDFVECAFDIVTPSEGSLIHDAEVLLVADELLREFETWDVKYFFRLNHGLLLRGILMHCGIPDDHHAEVFAVLRESEKMRKEQRVTQLQNFGLSEQVSTSLLSYLAHEGSPGQIGSSLRHVMKRKNSAASDIKKALHELETIFSHATAFGIKCEVVVAPSLIYNPTHFSGMICQLVRKRNKGGVEIMAAGGRYDALVQTYQSKLSLGGEPPSATISAVGISISMERILALLSLDEIHAGFSAYEVVVFAQSHLSLNKEKAEIAGKLWSAGIRACLFDVCQSVDEAQQLAQDMAANHLVIIRDADHIRVRSLEKDQRDRFNEKRVPAADLVDFLQKQKSPADNSFEASRDSCTGSRSIDRSACANYNFRFLDKKVYSAPLKKRLESMIATKLVSSLQNLSSSLTVEVMAFSLPGTVIRTLASLLNFDDERAFKESVAEVVEKHTRFRKDLASICDELKELRFEKNSAAFVLYSAEDHVYRIVLL